MRNSLWFKLFIGIIVFSIIIFSVMIFLNTTYLEKYYLKQKKEGIQALSEKIKKDYNGSIDDIKSYLIEIDDKSIGTIFIFNNSGQIKYTSTNNTKLYTRPIPMGLTRNNIKLRANLKAGKSFMFPYNNPKLNIKTYNVFTPLSNNDYLIISSPVTPMKESIAIMNKFNYYIIIISLIVAFIFAFIYSKIFTKPIIELNEIAKNMSKLDFSKSYQSRSSDEIGQLGKTLNILSSNLSTTIDELNQANAKLTADIQREKILEEQRKELISNISHELKTPIALIQGYGEGLQEAVITNKEDKDYYCEVIIDESKKMNKLVMELLELSHLESGFFKLNNSHFDIVELINNILQKYKDIIAKKNIDITIETNGKVIDIYGDITRIERVITNLFNNAIDHVNNEGIIQFTITYAETGNVRFEIFNSGKNISQEESVNIWNSFYKSDKARTRELGGTGLGLSIVKGILKLHNFSYGLYNKPNGVTFWFDTNK